MTLRRKKKLLVPSCYDAAAKGCPQCYRVVYNATKQCPSCGHMFYLKVKATK